MITASMEKTLAQPGRNEYQHDDLLTTTQERLIIARIQRDKGDLDAQERLIRANIPYISQIASKFTGRGIDLEDLQQVGCIAMIRAAQQFDLHCAYRLSTYATYKIRQAMQREVENHGSLIHIPSFQHQSTRVRRRQAENNDQDTNSGGLLYEDVERALRQPISLDAPLEYLHGEHSISDILEDPQEPLEDTVLQTRLRAEIDMVLTSILTTREKRIVEMIYGLHESHPDYPYTLDEIGRQEGMSRERIRQIGKAALNKLRASPFAHQVLGYQDEASAPREKAQPTPCTTQQSQLAQPPQKRKHSLTRGRKR